MIYRRKKYGKCDIGEPGRRRMEYRQVNTVIKESENEFTLWTINMPRSNINKIHWLNPIVTGSLDEIIDEIQHDKSFLKKKIHCIITTNNVLGLYDVEESSDYNYAQLCHGRSVSGTREKIKTLLLENLKKQGYIPRENVKLQHVDVIETMRKIREYCTGSCQDDLKYETEILREAATDIHANKNFFWLSMKYGTLIYPERDIYIKDTEAYSSWTYNGGQDCENVKAYWLKVSNRRDGSIIGDIKEIDFQEHLDFICTYAHMPTSVEIVYRYPSRIISYSFYEYNHNRQQICQNVGTIEHIKYLVKDEKELAYTIDHATWSWARNEPMVVDSYLKRLKHDTLYDYGYTAGDMELVHPLDAKLAVEHGLSCYALFHNGSREAVSSNYIMNQHWSDGNLFGMPAEEKDLLKFLKSECALPFTENEMREVYSLVLQESMKNEPEKAFILDRIAYKFECIFPQITAEFNAPEYEEIYAPEEEIYAPEDEEIYSPEDFFL